VCVPAPFPPCAPPFPGVVYQLPTPTRVVRDEERDALPIVFPQEDPVLGGGGLYAWGQSVTGIDPSTITATCGSATVARASPPASGTGGIPNTWAFRIDGLPTGTPVTLKVYYMDQTVMPPVKKLGSSWTFTPA
jgi:hypothetical protein